MLSIMNLDPMVMWLLSPSLAGSLDTLGFAVVWRICRVDVTGVPGVVYDPDCRGASWDSETIPGSPCWVQPFPPHVCSFWSCDSTLVTPRHCERPM